MIGFKFADWLLARISASLGLTNYPPEVLDGINLAIEEEARRLGLGTESP